MGIGEAISKGFGVAKKSLPVIMLLFIVGAAFSLMNLSMTPPPAEGAAAAPPPPGLIAVSILFIFVTIFLQAGSMGYIRDVIKSGSAPFGEFLASGGRYYLRLLLLGLVISLVIGVFVLLAALSLAFLQQVAVLGTVLAILFSALGLYFVILLFFAPYAAVVDERGVGAAIKTSMRTVKKNILKLLGISLLLILIGFGIGILLGAILAGLSFVIKAEQASQVVFAVLSSFVNAFLGVVVTATFMNFYLSIPDRNANNI